MGLVPAEQLATVNDEAGTRDALAGEGVAQHGGQALHVASELVAAQISG